MDPVLIGVISDCTALVASIIAPIVTLTVAKRQFNATVLSANRQDGSKHCGTWLPNLSRSWLRLGRQIQVEGQMGRRTWCAQRRARIAGEARTARSSQSKIRLL